MQGGGLHNFPVFPITIWPCHIRRQTTATPMIIIMVITMTMSTLTWTRWRCGYGPCTAC